MERTREFSDVAAILSSYSGQKFDWEETCGHKQESDAEMT